MSILTFDPKKNANKIATANNYFKRLKTLRHPNILPFLDGLELDATNPQVAYIVTEEVIPLEEYLNSKTENGETIVKQYPASIAWGFYQISV